VGAELGTEDLGLAPWQDVAVLGGRRKRRWFTTGFSFFVECLRHSAKADIHSTKPLPSVTLGKGRSVNSLLAKTSLPSALYRVLGKAFAEC